MCGCSGYIILGHGRLSSISRKGGLLEIGSVRVDEIFAGMVLDRSAREKNRNRWIGVNPAAGIFEDVAEFDRHLGIDGTAGQRGTIGEFGDLGRLADVGALGDVSSFHVLAGERLSASDDRALPELAAEITEFGRNFVGSAKR